MWAQVEQSSLHMAAEVVRRSFSFETTFFSPVMFITTHKYPILVF